jgi:small subunit ribosomal protein S17
MKERGRKKHQEGIVISNKMDKTVVVKVERLVRHLRYKRMVKRITKFYAHDEENKCEIGDKVLILETRPLSKLKRWKVVKIIEKSEGLPLEEEKEEISVLEG